MVLAMILENKNEDDSVNFLEKFKDLPCSQGKEFSYHHTQYFKKLENIETADDENIGHRLKICQSCDFWRPIANSKFGICSRCSCALSSKIKNKTSKCPIERW